MRQRVLIAMALLCDPDLLIADEPTTALDVTIQAQILDLIRERKEALGAAVVLITHDLGVVAQMANRVAVMYAGKIVEEGPVDAIFHAPKHPYTIGLARSIPRLDDARGSALVPIPGAPPTLSRLPSGCPFHPRCAHAIEVCRSVMPLPRIASGVDAPGDGEKRRMLHTVRCHVEDVT
jgi:peptide/nickel transport system ATP-binding protein/oligopeptide transport system ATP-binding protein